MYGGRPFWWVVKDVRLVGHPPKRATYTKTLRWLKSATVDEVRTKLRPSFLRNSSTFATLRWTRPHYLRARSFDLCLTHPPSLRYGGRGLNNCNPVFELSFAHCSSEIHPPSLRYGGRVLNIYKRGALIYASPIHLRYATMDEVLIIVILSSN